MSALTFSKWFQRIPRPAILFAGITLVFLAALALLSWRVIGQDRAVERQRWLERCEVAAGNAAEQLTRQLSELRQLLDDTAAVRAAQVSTPGTTLIVFRNGFLEESLGVKLPFYPALRDARESLKERFRAAEAVEFSDKQPLKAAAMYAQLVERTAPDVRAAALVRLARTYRKANLPSRALETYGRLEGVGTVAVEGDPAEMLAHFGRAEIYSESGDAAALKNEASTIAAALAQGRWTLSRSSYEFLSGQCREWLGGALPNEPSADALAVADATDAVYHQWKNGALSADSSGGRRTFWSHEQPAVVVWKLDAGRLSLICAGPSFLKAVLGTQAGSARGSTTIVLEDSEGHRVLGSSDARSPVRAVRTASLTALPWTIYAVPSDPQVLAGVLSGQARVMLAGLALMILFALAAGGFMARSVTREIAVARLQADFVAAVSHEFRSPLTTMIQLSEMLVRGRVSGDERRKEFYQTLLSESRRLHALVESILDFRRLEAGKYQYDFRTTDLNEFARGVVGDFSKLATERGYKVEICCEGGPIPVRADRDALGRACWNLLDNALKYSPDRKIIRVETACGATGATLSVRDLGLGIPPHEQQAIFVKFVRGAAAREHNIKGAGIGLAMARSIVEAHGGAIEVESIPGEGSTFRMCLPKAEA